MKKLIRFVLCLTAVLLAAAAAVPAALTASASEDGSGGKPFVVRFERADDGQSVTMTAVFSECDPESEVNTLFAALSYDTSMLSITQEDITVLSGGMSFRTAVNEEKGIASVESAYINAPLQKGDSLVSFRFTLLEGTDASALNDSHICPCTDNVYLDELSPTFSGSGGVILGDGANTYSVSGGSVGLSFDLPPAPQPEQEPQPAGHTGGGCSSSKSGETAAVIVFAAAAVLLAVRFRVR